MELKSDLEEPPAEELDDPLHEEKYRVTKNIIHKYNDRALFLVSNKCFKICDYCTRNRILEQEQYIINFEDSFDYIKNHPEIRDVIISGGDPLCLNDEDLDYILTELYKIKSVEIIRIGTRTPVVKPERITDSLIEILKKFKPLYMNIHFTDSNEITNDVKIAVNKLADNGIVLGSQTVLLKDINDDVNILKKLFHDLVKLKVKPYYLYSMDRIKNSEKYYVSLKKGIQIIEELKLTTSGLCIPNYVYDSSYGKIPINNSYFKEVGDDEYIVNFKNKEFKIKNGFIIK